MQKKPKTFFLVCISLKKIYTLQLDILFCQITTFIKVRVAFVIELPTLKLIDFTKIYQLKGLKSKNKSHTNFYECCDLMKKYN